MIPSAKPYTIRGASEALGVSYAHIWRLVRRGDIPHVRLGGKILIPASFVQDVLDGKPVIQPTNSAADVS